MRKNISVFIVLMWAILPLGGSHAATFDLATGLLVIPSLVINGSQTITDVQLRLNSKGTWELVSFSGPSTTENLPLTCSELDEDVFNLIQPSMSVTDVENLLGCTWFQKVLNRDFQFGVPSFPTYSWEDNKCSSIDIVYQESGEMSSAEIIHNRGGCDFP